MGEDYSEKELIRKRKEKIYDFFRRGQVWIFILLVAVIFLGVYIRALPMADHGGNPGLWDVTTNSWTLGPDLDPWLFMRQAEMIDENGSIYPIDGMRNVPLGFDNSKETKLLPYLIFVSYKLSKLFYSDATPIFGGVILPLIMFALTIISFFFFVREIFIQKGKNSARRAGIIALISSFFMVIVPIFLSRTIAGIPEKESAGFFFMFLAFYLFLKSYKSEKIRNSVLFGVSAGIATALMGLIWGGVIYVYLSIGVSVFVAFLFNKIKKKESLGYASWFVVSVLIMLTFSNRESVMSMLTSLYSGSAFFVLLILLIDFFIWKSEFFKKKFDKSKIPHRVISVIVSVILILILALIFMGPSFVLDKIKAVHQTIFKPVQGRWGTTVAENRQPYFTEWGAAFGPNFYGIPLFFVLFLVGSFFLVYRALKNFNKKERIKITLGYIILVGVMIFSRFSSDGIFNGENFFSQVLYYGGILFFVWVVGKIYLEHSRKEVNDFEKINFAFVFAVVLIFLGIFSSRSAVRLIMVLAPIASIFVGYLIVESVNKFFKTEKNKKTTYGIIMILILAASLFSAVTFYQTITVQSYNMIPTSYNQQWQKAMSWVRDNTPQDAVFGHWWDYGYWVQSIGKRATVLDGGNFITFWNYWMGRLVLTGDNQKDALDFLYSHDATHLLIDSTDIGKYSAFSSIGSDENYDRLSWIQPMLLDGTQTSQNENGSVLVYSSTIPLDEDLIFNQDGKEILLPSGNSYVIGAIVYTGTDNRVIMPPTIVVYYSGKQYTIEVKNIAEKEDFISFDRGIDATLYMFPSLSGNQVNERGALMYLSPRVMEGMLAQKYILNDPYNNFPNFKLVHTQSNVISENVKLQIGDVSEFFYYQGIQGPIKIWEIEYTGDEEVQQKYLDRDHSKYLSWDL